MTALAIERLTPEMDRDPICHLYKPSVKAAAKIFAGAIVVMELASGFVKPGATGTGLVALGRAEFTADNTLGANGAIGVEVRQGVFKYANSAGVDAIAAANTFALCYVVDDQTVALTSGGGTRSVAGRIVQVDADGVWVQMGAMVDPNAVASALASVGGITGLRARAVAVANVNLASGLVTGQVIDGVTLVTGDRVLLVAQSTPAQNGLYVVVAAGAATFAPEWQLGLFTASGIIQVSEGTAWSNSEWKATAAQATAGGFYVVGTTDPLFYPRKQAGSQALTAGAATVSNLFILSATLSAFSVGDQTAANATKYVPTAGRGSGSLALTGTTTDSLGWSVINF